MLVYISGPYRAETTELVEKNIEVARTMAARCWEAGHIVICPHTNTAHFEHYCSIPQERYLSGDLEILSLCDAIVMVTDWSVSVGAQAEKRLAEQLGIPVYYDVPPLHPVQANTPIQAQCFRQLMGVMYRTHLGKNLAYSPVNISGLGQYGVIVRAWDKVCRLLNLLGFKLKAEFVGMSPASEKIPYESLEDTWLDLAVYGVIGWLNLRGVWGK